MIEYLQINIKRIHFSGGSRIKSVLLFPITKKEEIPAILEKMGREFCTYLSEFNKNSFDEYDCRSIGMTDETIDCADNAMFDKLTEYRHGLYPAKSIYIKGCVYEKSLMSKVDYCVEMEVNPPMRDKHPEQVFTMTIRKDRDVSYLKQFKGQKFGAYTLA